VPTVNMLEAKSNLSELVRTVEAGEHAEIIIARNGQPVARLVPIAKTDATRRIGIARGMFTVPDDIDADNDAIAAMFGVVAPTPSQP
jgi:prevent-host-death family protein